MKKLLAFLLLTALLCPGIASAGERLYSVSQLKDVTSPRWTQTYQAHGRTIEVDEAVIIPDVETMPVLTVRLMPEIPEPRRSELASKYAQAARQDPDRISEFETRDFATSTALGFPKLWDEKKGYKVGLVGQNTQALFDFELNQAYADNNPLTLSEALEIAQRVADETYPGMELWLRNVALYSRTYWKNNGQPIIEKGNYFLELSQVFHGIPLMASTHNAFTETTVGDELWWLEGRGLVRAEVYDAASYAIAYWLYEETGVIHQDVPLLPFDAVKHHVEKLIQDGYVRFIDSVTLGYVQYDTADPDEMVLAPAWVVWCEYDKQGPRHERKEPLYDDSLFVHNEGYRPIILNAQTGEMIDPESTARNRCQCPAIITW